ncbi:MAG: UDP-N-acetylmuramoyl-tripeptide--D-alanyl-D-alanine ligase [Nitrospirae bacterium]|nr:UDP-N-acetylmuramoyl-tripeptide--D-alanyl-D-alanine ligase [Nitrospirota bacterium]
MALYSLTEVLEATGGRLLLKGAETFTGISIDSRTIKENELFIALKGERFDGHDFLEQALNKGSGSLVSIPPVIFYRGKSIIYVNNTLKALQNIARYRRLSRKTRVIAVTGSNGKTTTKEMIARILSCRYTVLCNRGNLNNQIGLPLSLSELDGQEMVVLEMGASRQGDIDELCQIALPNVGVITNIGPAHLEGFGSLQGVLDTKTELLRYVESLIINYDDPMLRTVPPERLKDKRIITFGIKHNAHIKADCIEYGEKGIDFSVHIKSKDSFKIHLPLYGLFNIYNALAAVAVGLLYDIPVEEMSRQLGSFKGVPMRVEIETLKGAMVISDVYNANPVSMEEALKELVRLKKRRAIAVLGDMLELGAYAEAAHREVGRLIATLSVDVVIAVGSYMKYMKEELNGKGSRIEFYHVDSPEEAKKILMNIIREGDTVLVKGSRGMNMERVLEA